MYLPVWPLSSKSHECNLNEIQFLSMSYAKAAYVYVSVIV